ncbi:MAG: right-handed parallel beta-helix repeat-containing protein [Phycisphaerales bacterium]|nr:right-handed parallel beta-helix repeat-containing protein [Phycisphaerales bacterium]
MNGFGIARRVALVSLAVGAAAWVVVAGPLNPPAGAVSSTYKTLSEVEPRIAINATNTPGDATSKFVISQAGSYYLTGNINVSTALNGIKISASDVTIDLNGFELIGSTSAYGAIVDSGSLSGISVRNGRLCGWSQGGVVLDQARGCLIEDLTIIDVGGDYGIYVLYNSVIRNCTVDAPGLVSLNLAGIGTQCCTLIQGCHVQGGDSTSAGIYFADTCTVTDCVVNNCLSDGIRAAGGDCTIINCTVNYNHGDGIDVGYRSRVVGCIANGNSQAGIHVVGTDSRIEDNNVTNNARGLDADSAGSIFLRNTASSNTTNFDLASGSYGVFVAGLSGGAVLGNSGGANIGGTDPNANYSY